LLGRLPGAFWTGFHLIKTSWVVKHRGKGADLHGIELHCLSLAGACLEGANLTNASIILTNLSGANLTSADLSHASLHQVNLQGANLRGANLRRSGLIGTNLRNADLSNADLTKATFWHPDRCVPPEMRHLANFAPPNLAGANLSGATLIGADLIDADLTEADLTGVVCDARTRWPESFDPEEHGVETLPMPAKWRLLREGVVLGTLQDCQPDYRPALPWFRCRFTPTAAFEEVRALFDEDQRLLNERRIEECEKVHREINALDLRLETPEGQTLAPWFIRIAGEELLFRY
jgi:hypothetical protein